MAESTVESLRVCRDEIQHEYTILSNRLSSYITSQAFLASGYAVSMGNNVPTWGHLIRMVLPLTLGVLGVLLSLRALPGISGASRVIEMWHERQYALMAACEFADYAVMQAPEYRAIQSRGLAFSKAAVWAFGAGWVVLISLAAWIAWG
jgi:hypothetical protein